MKRIFFALLGFAAMSLAFSCTDDAETDGGGIPVDIPTSVELSEKELSIVIGESAELRATVYPESKAGELIWESADSEIASFTETEAISVIRVDGNSLGRTTIIAVIDNIIEKCIVEVVAKEAESVSLDRTSLELNVGDTETLVATVEPEDITDPSISWTSDNPEVASVVLGDVKALAEGTATITARCAGKSASCVVTVSNVYAQSITLDIIKAELSVNETIMLTAMVAPSNVTFKDVKWNSSNSAVASVECIDGSPDDDIVNGKVTALSEGTTIITASIEGLAATCEITVNPVQVVLEDPKVGDYYYSDGTWSDGGLISINGDGTNPVWADVKPAPVEGKTVIGIVFQTDQSRMHSVDKENGFTHGYVVCTKSAHAPGSTETMYSIDEGISFMNGKKLGSSWYSDLNGYVETLAAVEMYAGRLDQIPAFDWVTTDFSPSAPAGTSGWYLPSTGQMWDMMANLCGEEVAEYLLGLRTYGYDITYYNDKFRVSYDVIAKFNSTISLVADSQKEELVPPVLAGKQQNTCFLWCSTLYDDADGVACGFEIGLDGYFWTGCEWVNSPNVARPILAF